LDYLVHSQAASASLAENYVGLPMTWLMILKAGIAIVGAGIGGLTLALMSPPP
jgi:predicted NAD/FAD-binding protein